MRRDSSHWSRGHTVSTPDAPRGTGGSAQAFVTRPLPRNARAGSGWLGPGAAAAAPARPWGPRRRWRWRVRVRDGTNRLQPDPAAQPRGAGSDLVMAPKSRLPWGVHRPPAPQRSPCLLRPHFGSCELPQTRKDPPGTRRACRSGIRNPEPRRNEAGLSPGPFLARPLSSHPPGTLIFIGEDKWSLKTRGE